jgi:uncharacterized protein YbjT (DUF2867 family)
MDGSGVDLVTGAFGNTGRGIAERLRAAGRRVRTLTNHPDPSDNETEVFPYAFDGGLDAAFEGVDTFYNTYWARTGGPDGFDALVERSAAMFAAARRAGVRRIVHMSVANPSLDSPYAYFRAKARVEEALRANGVPAAIVRPALIFGGATVPGCSGGRRCSASPPAAGSASARSTPTTSPGCASSWVVAATRSRSTQWGRSDRRSRR